MYIESQREKPINLYIKYGLKALSVIRELGYSKRDFLKMIWYTKLDSF